MPASPSPLPPVAQVIETLGMGGAEQLAVRFANALAGRGHASHLVVIEAPGPLRDRVAAGVHLHELGHVRGPIGNPPRFLASLRRGRARLRDLVRATGIGVMQTHLPGANFWGLMAQWTGICPVIATIHNNQEFEYGDADDPVRRALRMQAYRQIIRRCAFTVAVSDDVRASMCAQLGLDPAATPRLRTVTNGVEPGVTLTPDERAAIRQRLGVPAEVPLILAAGRLGPQKNHADLVAAAAHLRAQGRPFRLVIAGEGEQRPQLEARIAAEDLAPHVQLPGNLADLDRVMAAADVFAMASLWEGLPLVLLEAMAAGLPPVAYAIAGVTDVLTSPAVGRTVPARDVATLAVALAAFLDRPADRASVGAAARDHVARHFAFRRTVDQLEALYAEAAGR